MKDKDLKTIKTIRDSLSNIEALATANTKTTIDEVKHCNLNAIRDICYSCKKDIDKILNNT